jgi:D-beta-D-heptose 7-phosphate kinase/D-beta-D-heptose 1-phosphate adenosyltransferase
MNKKVWVNGCFDLIHPGHIALLVYAKSLGDVYVGIDSDSRIKKMKGLLRPIFTEVERQLLLSSLIFVNEVKIFDSSRELTKLIKDLSPDYMIVGEEYRDKKVIGMEHAKELLFYPRIGNWSTTRLVDKIKSNTIAD